MQQLEQMTPERYQIQRIIARGGMATIYLAYDSERDETVAVKIVHRSANEYYERFSREAHAMFMLQHEHILPALDYGEYENWSYLVTPYIENGTLTQLLAKGPLSLHEAETILGQLASALQCAHENGILHRDIKPSNILMRDNNHAYLADFGLVKRVGEENHLTVTGFLIGTPEYMAPELAEAAASPQSDVYALGVLLYQMISGRVPFTGNTPMATYLKHIRDVPPPISSINPDIPTAVEHVMTCALDKDPRRRYQSAQELYQAYHQSLNIVEQQRQDIINQTTVTFMRELPAPHVTIKKGPRTTIHKHASIPIVAASVILLAVPVLLLGASVYEHQPIRASASNFMHAAGASPTVAVQQNVMQRQKSNNQLSANTNIAQINHIKIVISANNIYMRSQQKNQKFLKNNSKVTDKILHKKLVPPAKQSDGARSATHEKGGKPKTSCKKRSSTPLRHGKHSLFTK